MREPLHPDDWISAEVYSAEADISVQMVIDWIKNGQLAGGCFAQRWYVAPPLVFVQPPPNPSSLTARIVISACRLGPLLTAGRGRQVFAVELDDDRASAALAALNEAMRKRPVLPLAIDLGGTPALVDSSLWCDLGAALVEIEVLAKGYTQVAGPDDLREEPECLSREARR